MSPRKIKKRYFRKVIKYPKGAVVHHGDCKFFEIKICTCGLLHDLAPIHWDDMKKLYPKWVEENISQRKVIDAMRGDNRG